jgi:anti-sigma factor RsiW
MTCRKIESNAADLLFEPDSVPASVKAHVEDCAECTRELAELRATMNLMNAWAAPEPSPYFDTRLHARLREERAAAPAGLLERLRAHLLFGSNMHLRPVAASALTVLLAIGGATYAGFVGSSHTPQTSAAVGDLQSLDKNQQVFQQLDSLDQDDDDSDAPLAN